MRPFLRNIPDRPGVYLMKNGEGEIIYVGKALSLKKRVPSYFSASSGDDFRPAARHLIHEVDDLEVIITRNENEAFILENNLIKKFKPQYNVRLKDDKTFLSLRVDMRHPFPYPVPVRRRKQDGCLYFGPYSSSRAVRATLRILRTVVPLRDCTDREFASRKRPCIKYQIGRCPGPCVELIEKKAYAQNLKSALSILKGKVEPLIVRAEEEMAGASREMAFEKAARFRDQIAHLKIFSRTQEVDDSRFYDVDVIAWYGDGGLIELTVLHYREGKLQSSQPYGFDLPVPEEELIGQFLLRYYDGDRYIPAEVLIPCRVPDMDGLQRFLKGRRKAAFALKAPTRGPALRLLTLARENARLSLNVSREAAVRTDAALTSLRDALGLKKKPASIEGIDISTTGGDEAVGGLVHFHQGLPLKKQYRKYRIKTVAGMDDCAMIREVIDRRLKRGLKEKTLPSLILVDGGLGQLRSAWQAARELGVDQVPIIGIQKGDTRARAVQVREEEDDWIVTLEQGPSRAVAPGTPAFHLLQRIRDEAHRFAIQYHRKRRNKKGLSSPLDQVEGLGKARKRDLLAHFGGLKGLRRASVEEIARAPGLGPVLSVRVYRALHS